MIDDEFTLYHKTTYADDIDKKLYNKKKAIKTIKKIKKPREFVIIKFDIILKLSDLCI